MTHSWTLPASLDLVLETAAERSPDAGIAVIDRRGNADRRTYPELLEAVNARAGRLVASGLCAGDVVLISLENSFAWVECWLGAVHMGALPVAVAPAGAMGSGRAHIDKLEGLALRLDVKLLIGGASIAKVASEFGLEHILQRHITPEALDELEPASFENSRNAPDDLAFLQLTSGSTGLPRGVAIRHSSVIHNIGAIVGALGVDPGLPENRNLHGVSWLPLHHDMGMVGCLLSSMAHGWSLDLISARQFLARPESWLAAIGRAGRVTSPAPNFAYQACVERGTAARLEGVDLSGWESGLTGAEMVRPETVKAFIEQHAPLGFDGRAIRPCYGLAEATLAVTFDQRHEGVRTATIPGDPTGAEVVCVGAPVRDTLVRITDEHGEDLPSNSVGGVRVSGPGIFAGYYRDEEATAECLVGGELTTGDLGFLKDGELYITGRTKDILIIRGSNLMPHELEWCAEESVGGGGKLRAGAFSVGDGGQGEVAVLVVETAETDPEIVARQAHDVRARVGREVGLTLHDVALVRRGRLPKTSSGKIQRRELRRRYLAGEIERLPES